MSDLTTADFARDPQHVPVNMIAVGQPSTQGAFEAAVLDLLADDDARSLEAAA